MMCVSSCFRLQKHFWKNWISVGRRWWMHRRRNYLRTSFQLHQCNRLLLLRLHQRVSAEQLWRDRERHQPLHRCAPSRSHASINPDLSAAFERLRRRPCPPVGFFPHRYWRVLRGTRHLWPQHCVHQRARDLLLLLPRWILPLHRNLLDSWDVVLPMWAKPGLKIK